MPLYDFECKSCGKWEEHFVNSDTLETDCECGGAAEKRHTFGGVKRNDAPWIRCVNGYMNDLEFVHQGKQEFIETRDQARAAINRMYSDPHPRVQELRKRYLERF